MEENKLVIGIDYGTDSCRVVVVTADTGLELASVVKYYPRWKKGYYCDSARNQYRQHPLDFIECLEEGVKEALAQCPVGSNKNVVGIGFDTTGSTPVLLNEDGLPLALLPEFSNNPNAMFILWKDHTSTQEADEINSLAKQWQIDYTAYSGGTYSSEWVWAKMLHVLREDELLRNEAYSWVEHCDWMPALLTGKTKPEKIMRSRCAAGHKAMWNESWGGLPSTDFWESVDPLLKLFNGHLFTECYTSDNVVGNLTEEWALRLDLNADVVVAVGALDCHMGAIGTQIKEDSLVRVMGTSTCDIMVVSPSSIGDRLIKGICGQVDGSVIPGMIGLEAGQSAFGDVYAWFKRVIYWPIENVLIKSTLINNEVKELLAGEIEASIISELTAQAEIISSEEFSLIALDWFNGRRTPDANSLVKGLISGLTLGTSAPMIFKALVEATAFGSKAIVDCFLNQGIIIKEIIAVGGISIKSPYVIQVLSNVLGMPVRVACAEQACALGAAMCASVAAGMHARIEDAQLNMGKGFACEYIPDAQMTEAYEVLYKKYLAMGAFVEHDNN